MRRLSVFPTRRRSPLCRRSKNLLADGKRAAVRENIHLSLPCQKNLPGNLLQQADGRLILRLLLRAGDHSRLRLHHVQETDQLCLPHTVMRHLQKVKLPQFFFHKLLQAGTFRIPREEERAFPMPHCGDKRGVVAGIFGIALSFRRINGEGCIPQCKGELFPNGLRFKPCQGQRTEILPVFLAVLRAVALQDPGNRDFFQYFGRTAHMVLIEVGDDQRVNPVNSLLLQPFQDNITLAALPAVDQHGALPGDNGKGVRLSEGKAVQKHFSFRLRSRTRQQHNQQKGNYECSITASQQGLVSNKKLAEGYLEKNSVAFLPSDLSAGNPANDLVELAKRKRKDIVTEQLKLFDSRITTLEILNNVAYIGLEGIDQLLTVNMQGDGLRRYLNIVAASANPMNNILLIDEIDNGLHYSAYKKLWEAIFVLATTTNKQVFVTTHSKETLYKLHEMLDINILMRVCLGLVRMTLRLEV